MTDPVFLHYTQAELDRNFDQRGWVTNAEEVIARYIARSNATRQALPHRADLRYGPSADEILDVFPAAASPAPIQIFVHGGAWKNFTKNDYSFPAAAFGPAGIHTVILNFAKLPAVRLPDVVAQVRNGIEWTYRNAESFGGDPRRLYVSAHSSGAHLTAMALATNWAARGLPEDVVKGATLISGPFDLEPVVLSARGAYVKLTPDEVRAYSPVLQAHRITCPMIVAYAEHDTDEFRRQSEAFAAALERAGHPPRLLLVPKVNHFELPETLADPKSPLVQTILEQVGATTAHRRTT
jgi:arylformamidase